MELTERKKKILKSVVDAYISSGEPIGSKLLTSSEQFDVSSATIRSEMNDLEEMGYLHQPHTSAGRVPTALGYKTYVSDLMEQYLFSIDEIRILNELMTFKMNEIGTVLEKASRIISQMTNYTSFSFCQESGICAKRFETVYIDDSSVLLVLISDTEPVRSRQLRLPLPITREELNEVTAAMNDVFKGATADRLSMSLIFSFEERLGILARFASPFARAINSILSEDAESRIHVEGATKLLEYPEFASAQKAKKALDMLEERSVIADVITKSDSEKLNVLIGEDDPLPVDDTGLVVHPVSIDGKRVGAIGVIGPKRMDYKKVIAGLNYIVAGLSGQYHENGDNQNNE